MNADDELLRRITRIEDLHAINNLRYRYWYALIDKDVDAMVECFCDDAALNYGFGVELKGKSDIRPFYEMLLKSENLIHQIPRGANGLVEHDSDTEAHGRWLVQVTILRKSDDKGRRSNVQYFENYRKVDGVWKIQAMKNDYFGFEVIEKSDHP